MADVTGLRVVGDDATPPAELVLEKAGDLLSLETERCLILDAAVRGAIADVTRAAGMLDELVAGGSGDVREIRDLLRACARRAAAALD